VSAPIHVHWNGRLVPADEAMVSVFDAGFLYGDGIYETLRIYRGCPFGFDRHWRRLEHGARGVGLSLPARDDVRRGLDELLRADDLPSAVARITITRGRLARRLDLSSAGRPSVLVTAEAIDPGADDARARGVRVVHSSYVRPSDHSLAGVKSTNYQVSLLARNEAREQGAAEVLVPNQHGHVVEAAAANVFVVEGGVLVTPPLRSGILGGITREVVLEVAGDAGLPLRQETLAPERVEAADEVFLTGTTIEVTPVVTIGDRPVAAGRPGPITLDLRRRYRERVDAETRPSGSEAPSDSTR